jgi:hypothetical protein
MNGSQNVLLSHSRGSIHFCDKWGLPRNVLSGEPCHLPFGQLLDPICLLMLAVPHWYDKVWHSGFIINNIPLEAVTCWKWDRILVGVQPLLKVGYFVVKGQGGQGILLLPFSYGGGEALGNVEDGSRVVLVELHHRLGRVGGDGSCRSRGGPNGGRRAKGRFDQSVNGDG